MTIELTGMWATVANNDGSFFLINIENQIQIIQNWGKSKKTGPYNIVQILSPYIITGLLTVQY